GKDRREALDRLGAALARTRVAGPRTNLAFLIALVNSGGFRQEAFDTGFIDSNLVSLGAVPHGFDRAAAAFGVAHLLAREQARIAARSAWNGASPWDATDGFQLADNRAAALPVLVDGENVSAALSYEANGARVTVDGEAPATDPQAIEAGDAVYVLRGGRQTLVRLKDFAAVDVDHLDTGGLITAPMHGKVLAILAEKGDAVAKGRRVALIEA